MRNSEQINPDLLVWARETAGFGIREAVSQLGWQDTKTLLAFEKLAEMEAGTRVPSRSQLTRFAEIYRRPLIVFYRDTPPPKGERGEDFRTNGQNLSKRENALLDTLLRDIRARHSIVKSILEDEDAQLSPIVGSLSMATGYLDAARMIAEAIGLHHSRLANRGSPEKLFADLREKIESLGIFVILMGDLGSYHSAIESNIFRGFAIADKIAPFIVLNDQEAKIARPFTLLHELVHIFLGKTGVSGEVVLNSGISFQTAEVFCNKVASELLLPQNSIRPPESSILTLEAARAWVQTTAAQWNVSQPMVAYRAHQNAYFGGAIYKSLTMEYNIRRQNEKVVSKENTDTSGPSYYTVKQYRLGQNLMRLVSRALRSDSLSYTRAAKVLGTKSSSVEPLLRRFENKNTNFVAQAD